MDKIFIAEILSKPAVVFALFYMFMVSKGLGYPLEFSLFMSSVVAFLTYARRQDEI